jgi:hypothetical protein
MPPNDKAAVVGGKDILKDGEPEENLRRRN